MHLSKGRANGFKLPGGALSTEHRCNEPPDATATEVWVSPTSADGLRLEVCLMLRLALRGNTTGKPIVGASNAWVLLGRFSEEFRDGPAIRHEPAPERPNPFCC